MKATLLILTMLSALLSLSQTDKKYLYLENNETGKIKKINLKSTWLLNYHIDTLEGDYNSYTSYISGDVSAMNFKADSVYFNSEGSNSWSEENSEKGLFGKTTETYLTENIILPMAFYGNTRAEIYITRQSKSAAIIYFIGGTLAYTAILNSLFVAPLLGLNDGKFSGYSFSRLWRGELYSAIGLSVGIPLVYLFREKAFYFQAFNDQETWSVVEPKF